MSSSALLSSAAYQPPSRQVHLKLNTIIEEYPETPEVEQRGRSRTPSHQFSPLSASTISSYYQRSRASREFDDLYDVSECESDQDSIEIPARHLRKSSNDSVRSKKISWDGMRKNRYPSIVIPSPTSWPTIEKFKKDAGLALLTSATIPLAAEVLAKLNTKVQTSSNPPSLDGSLVSDQLANSSSPPTPKEFNHPEHIKNWQRMLATSMYSNEDIQLDIDDSIPSQHSSMLLSPEAFNVLQSIALEQEVDEPQSEEMVEIVVKADAATLVEQEPMSAISEYSMSAISLPSPGGIFGSGSNAEIGFAVQPITVEAPSPTFSSVEEFYNSTCGQTLTISASTSPRLLQLETAFIEPASPEVVELLDVLDRESAFSTITSTDRTSNWLSQQNSWLASLREDTTEKKVQTPSTPVAQTTTVALPDTPESVIKRAVRFLDTEVAKEADRIATRTTEEKGDPLFYHAFQRMSMAASPTDSFVHRHSRFDAMQAQRTSLQLNYVNSLLGNYRSTTVYRPAPQRPVSMFPNKESANLDDDEKQYFAALEREREATEQLAPAMWVVEALRYLSGGSLFNSPVSQALKNAPELDSTPLPDHVRVLDLGGAPQCDWAWHCAQDFPKVKTYTAILNTQTHNPALHGPSNHRLVTVENFYALPFPDNHFDAISARSLAMYLKTTRPLGESNDEYDLCLKECLRVLKPGGYLEFFILDAELITSTDGTAAPQAAPLASKLSTEFSFNLNRLGYDACPTKSFLSRLRRNGFSNIKRAWMFLPIGGETEILSSMPETPPPSGAALYDEGIFARKVEAVQGPVGSSQDAAAVSGLVGGWMWESWVVKLAHEMGREGFGGLVGDVGGVIEEGRANGGGWRVLRGWGRKAIN